MNPVQYFTCLVVGCLLAALSAHADADQCSIRSFLRSSVSDKLQVDCQVNDQCTAVHCSGLFLKQIVTSGIQTKVNDTICFGTMINHCDSPMSMDIYLQYSAVKFSLIKRLYNNLEIPLANHMNLYIEMIHKPDTPNKVTIKVSIRFGTMFRALSYTLVPEHTYTLPSCPAGANTTHTPMPTLQPCQGPSTESPAAAAAATTTAAAATAAAAATHRPEQMHHQQHKQHHNHGGKADVVPRPGLNITSATYGKPCDPQMLNSCLDKEVCTYRNVCDCLPHHVISPYTGLCDIPGAKPRKPLPSVSPKTPNHDALKVLPHNNITIPPLANTQHHSSSIKNTAILTGLSVGAVVIVGTIVLVTVLIWRRQKSQMNHVPLLDNEEVVI
ncbi:uncharacterized protein LOC115215539 [Argonauta hians]